MLCYHAGCETKECMKLKENDSMKIGHTALFLAPQNQSVDHLTKASNNNNLEIHRNSYF